MMASKTSWKQKYIEFYNAIHNGDMELFNRLLHSVSINSKDKLGRNFLHVAICCGRVAMATALVNHPKFDPHRIQDSPLVPSLLHLLSLHSRDALEAVLPKVPGQLESRHGGIHTPLQYWFRQDVHLDLIRWLLRVGADRTKLFEIDYAMEKCGTYCTSMREFMIEEGLHHVIYRDKERVHTMLHCAVDAVSIDSVKELLKAGADVHIRSAECTCADGRGVICRCQSLKYSNVGEYAIIKLMMKWYTNPEDIQIERFELTWLIIEASAESPSFHCLVELYRTFFWANEEQRREYGGKCRDESLKKPLARVFAASFAISGAIKQQEIDEARSISRLDERTFNFLLNLYQMCSVVQIVTNIIRRKLAEKYNNIEAAFDSGYVDAVCDKQGTGYDIRLKEVRKRYIELFLEHAGL